MSKAAPGPITCAILLLLLSGALCHADDGTEEDAASANLALGKPVSATVDFEGQDRPERAVDGKRWQEDGWWAGVSWPSALEIDLGEKQEIGTVFVFLYADGIRCYPHKIEVSDDGENWRVVSDKSDLDTPVTREGVTHEFAATEARYVRVHVLTNTVNQAVHITEVEVYAPGEAPEPPKPPELPEPDADGFISLFNGEDFTGWIGDTGGYIVENGAIVCQPGGNLYTAYEFSDFVLRFEFLLTPGANNGLGIRTPPYGDAAYLGMELQILDNSSEHYKDLPPYCYHGSVYGVIPAKRGFLKTVGDWNSQEVIAKGPQITVILNGETIVDGDILKASEGGTMDGRDHPGLRAERGHIGFLGHGSRVEFRNLRIKPLE